MMNNIHRPAKAAFAFALASAAFAAAALPARVAESPAEVLQQLTAATSGALTQAQRGNDAFTSVHALSNAVLLADGAIGTPLLRAQNFLNSYGALPGVSDPFTQLVQKRVSTDRAGITHVHLDQVQSGLPVFGARLVVHMTNAGIVGLNGVFIPGLESLSATPAKDVSFLRERALVAAQKLYPTAGNLAVESTRLMFYRTGLLKGVEGRDYLAYEVMVKGGTAAKPVRERIILNANTGNVLNRMSEIYTALNRQIFTPNQDVPPVLTEGSALAPADPPLVLDSKTNSSNPAPDLPQNNLYIYAGGTYALYDNLFGAKGYDFTRPPMAGQTQKSVYLINDQCPNAYWNGDSTNYCPGFDADDVVSHEWSHAYTEYTSGLVYQYQSGALNESYSDIFGETYDLVNNLEGPLGLTLTEGDYYENGGKRWVVGEDLSEAAAVLLLRDMWDPDNFGNPLGDSPGSTITSPNYYCATGDNGGVHTNSGVPNHAYAMLVDGKTFNNVTIPAIGMTKAAHIYFQAQSQYQTPTSNFVAHADALEQSCRDLTGVTLNDVLGKPSTEKITAADCAAVAKAMEAVEMRKSVREKCGYVNVLKAESTTPALCATGKFATATFTETWENGIPAAWTQTQNLAGDTEPQPFNWGVTSSLPAPHTGKAAFADNNGFGTCAAGGDASASWSLDSPEITVPDAVSFLHFTHFMQSESGFDGGNLKYSVNGAAFAIVPAAAFTYNAHSSVFGDGPIAPGAPADPTGLVGGNNTSPLAGQVAWTGSDQGEATGSWGTTIVDLSKLSAAKDAKVKFRWEFGQDGCGGNLGWFVDDTRVFFCSATPPPNLPPLATLLLDKLTGEAPLTVQVTRGGSDSDFGDRVVSYTIAYGDGSTQADQQYEAGKATTVTAPHVFDKPGTYTIDLKVKDSVGLSSSSVTKTVTVTPKAGTTPVTPGVPGTVVSTEQGRFGGGAIGLLALLPLMGLALRRRKLN